MTVTRIEVEMVDGDYFCETIYIPATGQCRFVYRTEPEELKPRANFVDSYEIYLLVPTSGNPLGAMKAEFRAWKKVKV